MYKRVSRLLIITGVVLAVLGLSVNQYYMITQRLHIEGITEVGLFWGASLFLLGILYAFPSKKLTKILMIAIMSLANIGFLFAL